MFKRSMLIILSLVSMSCLASDGRAGAGAADIPQSPKALRDFTGLPACLAEQLAAPVNAPGPEKWTAMREKRVLARQEQIIRNHYAKFKNMPIFEINLVPIESMLQEIKRIHQGKLSNKK